MSDNYPHMASDQRTTRQEEIYDQIRRLIPIGSRKLPRISLSSLRIDEKNIEDLDAFYSAIKDLEAEGYVSIDGGKILPITRPELSDRKLSFFADHRARGATPREEIVGGRLHDWTGNQLRERFPEFTTPHEQSRYTVLERVQIVDDSPWAYTVSAFPFPMTDFDDLLNERGEIKQDVFHILHTNGHTPKHRTERLTVRFPYGQEAQHLGIRGLDRIPVAVALGTVTGENDVVELYFNVMRADRYVFPIEAPLSAP